MEGNFNLSWAWDQDGTALGTGITVSGTSSTAAVTHRSDGEHTHGCRLRASSRVFLMLKKSKSGKAISKQKGIVPELWIAPRFKDLFGERDESVSGASSHSRYLELADIALGFKRTTPKKKATPVHEVVKHDPYVMQPKKS